MSIYFQSRRSPVLSRYGLVASSQHLASQVGQEILKCGGNAVDACVAMNAILGVVEPTSTGLGGDCFVLFYNNSKKKVFGLNGSGHTSHLLTHKYIKKFKWSSRNVNLFHALNITVPGNVAGMLDILERFGTFSREQVLKPAIHLAESGFPVNVIASYLWQEGMPQLKLSKNGHELLIPNQKQSNSKTFPNNDFHAPKPGEIFKNPYVAKVLRKIVSEGKDGFYRGEVAEALVSVVKEYGGVLSLEDLAKHQSTWVDPISVNYKGINIWEIPPNGQGIAALMALNIYQHLNTDSTTTTTTTPKNIFKKPDSIGENFYGLSALNKDTVQDMHHKIECMRLGFKYARQCVADLEKSDIDIKPYLTTEFAKECGSKEIFSDRINNRLNTEGTPLASSDTVSFCAVDYWGNACSFISSNYYGFGTGIVPKGCGFTLQNRGFGFDWDNLTHPNGVGPMKRPYHTIIPGIATRENGDLYAAFSVMGGFMQPQGHFQILSNMIDKGMNAQECLDEPRFCISLSEGALKPQNHSQLMIEETTGSKNAQILCNELKKYGHNAIVVKGQFRRLFGRGQVIWKSDTNNVLWGGSDGRGDGCALGLEMPPNNINNNDNDNNNTSSKL